ncbi:alanine racemase [Ketogulonicigenium vulgare]|uniref:Alanine racemase n=1 Tax=Ketogulonicigenium vulgare (strain WSH-001) TaxID=759362 RepID=F9Y5H2_KETVW|nr:alanine racemase [Ketogulonicigenium vulgare]ADO42529.1 alanine racemase [Ketogulonicigenium vulgare Y25]AEM40725.1 Alanine racemase [Ketogulonicigenium vulgare WSH-001]ALJ80895.1 alanine racemase [Ketogulonicigenium vulgare]ANW33667.1 alanine racemase [Ketogulonicigenium vulgare]AOZ54442.1 alanine racemase [Ketogulonicigenium vulgare]
MTTGILTIDLDAIIGNWRKLAAMSRAEAGAVLKADAYGTGAARVGAALAEAGVRKFFVAVAEEGVALREAVGPAPEIFVLSGHGTTDTALIRQLNLTPVLNSPQQLRRQFDALPGRPFAIQLDTGMNRLGFEWEDWAAVTDEVLGAGPRLIMSHLACADEPDHPMNAYQLDLFKQMTEGMRVSRSLAATGGILLGPDYHFDLVRPGIGLHGAAPYAQGAQALQLDLPVIQTRDLIEGEVVGYGNTWQARRPTRVATLAAGYADGVLRVLGAGTNVYSGDIACPIIGRISMDLITVDITDLDADPEVLTLIGPQQSVDDLAVTAKTIGYEILTSLSPRYSRQYIGG